MAPSLTSIAQMAEGLTRVSRPLSASPVRSSSAIRQSTAGRTVNLANRSVESGLTRVSRPFPFTDASRANATAGRALRVSEAAGRAQTEAILNQSRRALDAQFRRQVLKDGVRTVAAPATRAAANVGGLLAKVPLVGSIIQKGSPYLTGAGPFAAVAALSVIPSIFEYFAPDVQSWLLGGWKQSGYKANQLPPGVGQSAVLYNLTVQVLYYNPNIGGYAPHPIGLDRADNVMGPIGSLKAPYRDGQGSSFGVYSPAGLYIASGGALYASYQANYAIGSVSVVRVDGVVETGAEFNPSGVTTQPTVRPTPSLAQTNVAEIAKLAALAAVAATIAAGRYRTQPPSARDALKTPQRRFGAQFLPSPTQTAPAAQPCKGNACGGANLDATKQNGEDLSKILELLNTAGILDMNKNFNTINQKLGAQIIDDRGNKIGLAGHALNMFKRINQVGDYLRFDRITNVLTLATTVHNAAMLSNQLEQTLASALSNALAAIGVKDADGNALDINSIVGKSVESAITAAIGAENYTALTTNWKKANRIYQASANLLNNVNSLRYSITGALETIGGMNAKVGNALKKYGVLGDNAYPWMNPSPDFDNKFMRGLEVVETAVSSVDSIASEVLSAQETVTEIGRQKTELATAVKDGTEKTGVDNTQQKEKATAAKAASKSPDITSDNLIKPEG